MNIIAKTYLTTEWKIHFCKDGAFPVLVNKFKAIQLSVCGNLVYGISEKKKKNHKKPKTEAESFLGKSCGHIQDCSRNEKQ